MVWFAGFIYEYLCLKTAPKTVGLRFTAEKNTTKKLTLACVLVELSMPGGKGSVNGDVSLDGSCVSLEIPDVQTSLFVPVGPSEAGDQAAGETV